MKSRPILFSGAMVRAILDGSKTQTRRICKASTQNQADIIGGAIMDDEITDLTGIGYFEGKAWREQVECPYGQPGDTLWVRECISKPTQWDVEGKVFTGFYRASEPERQVRWQPSIHMPRWASRITLEITGIRVERLQDIAEADAKAEGIEETATGWKSYEIIHAGPHKGMPHPHSHVDNRSPITSYRELWESINGAGSWDENPFVWVVEFRKVEGGAA